RCSMQIPSVLGLSVPIKSILLADSFIDDLGECIRLVAVDNRVSGQHNRNRLESLTHDERLSQIVLSDIDVSIINPFYKNRFIEHDLYLLARAAARLREDVNHLEPLPFFHALPFGRSALRMFLRGFGCFFFWVISSPHD